MQHLPMSLVPGVCVGGEVYCGRDEDYDYRVAGVMEEMGLIKQCNEVQKVFCSNDAASFASRTRRVVCVLPRQRSAAGIQLEFNLSEEL